MWDSDIRLIVNIFQKILPSLEAENSVEYLERHKHAVKAAGRELKFLRLAEPDEKSPFGLEANEASHKIRCRTSDDDAKVHFN
jgi:hypothetical protein